jgi:hypothetical protein
MRLVAINERIAVFERPAGTVPKPDPPRLLRALLAAGSWRGMREFLKAFATCGMNCDLSFWKLDEYTYMDGSRDLLGTPTPSLFTGGVKYLVDGCGIEDEDSSEGHLLYSIRLDRVVQFGEALRAALLCAAIANGERGLGTGSMSRRRIGGVADVPDAFPGMDVDFFEVGPLGGDEYMLEHFGSWEYVLPPSSLGIKEVGDNAYLKHLDGELVIGGADIEDAKDGMFVDENGGPLPSGSAVIRCSGEAGPDDALMVQRDLCGMFAESFFGLTHGIRRTYDPDTTPEGIVYVMGDGMSSADPFPQRAGELDYQVLEYVRQMIVSRRVGICPNCGGPVDKTESSRRLYCSRSCVSEAKERRRMAAYSLQSSGVPLSDAVSQIGQEYRGSVERWYEESASIGGVTAR